MHYCVLGLSPQPFRHLFGLSDAELSAHGAIRTIADRMPGYPDRIELRDAEPGEAVLLVNYTHQPAHTPYRASHAVFVLEHAPAAREFLDELPQALRLRPISLRAFDAAHMMCDADLAEGVALEPAIRRLLGDDRVAYLQAHYAKRGCYAARIERA
jgi:hypothetical protein